MMQTDESPWRFYITAIGFTWLVWIPLVTYTNHLGDVTKLDLPLWQGVTLFLILQLGAYGPSLTALVLSTQRFGGTGVRALLAQLFCWRVSPSWYVFALCIPAALQLAGLGIWIGTGGDPGGFDDSRWQSVIPAFLVMLTLGPLAEELGWRGYALPRLLNQVPAWQAATLMGLLASLWHVPLFFSTYPPMSGFSIFEPLFLAYLLYAVSRCFLYTWIYVNTGSVLLCVLFHAAGNVAIPLMFLTDLTATDRSMIVLTTAIPQVIFALYLTWRSAGTFRVRTLTTDQGN